MQNLHLCLQSTDEIGVGIWWLRLELFRLGLIEIAWLDDEAARRGSDFDQAARQAKTVNFSDDGIAAYIAKTSGNLAGA